MQSLPKMKCPYCGEEFGPHEGKSDRIEENKDVFFWHYRHSKRMEDGSYHSVNLGVRAE